VASRNGLGRPAERGEAEFYHLVEPAGDDVVQGRCRSTLIVLYVIENNYIIKFAPRRHRAAITVPNLLSYLEDNHFSRPEVLRSHVVSKFSGPNGTKTVQLEVSTNRFLTDDHGFLRGVAPAIQALNAMLEQFARTTIPIRLIGESGTGKEVYALAIHRLCGGEPGALKKISCSAIEPAPFLRALHELSQESIHQPVHTLFLDEIEELSLECQKLLLNCVPYGEFRTEEGSSRARVISATTHDLEHEVAAGRFRRELYFRLNGACLRLPPLRERTEDIPLLAEYFLARHSDKLKKGAPHLNKETMELLLSYHWPGNIRELENVARKIIALGDASLAVSDLRVARMAPAPGMESGRGSSLKMAARAASRQTERELILQALQRTKWNRKRAARELQISYKSLLYKLKQIETLGTTREK
jgi:two-component system, NtrC family, response regulator AtoC